MSCLHHLTWLDQTLDHLAADWSKHGDERRRWGLRKVRGILDAENLHPLFRRIQIRLGLGSVGLAVAERLRGFGMKIAATRWNFEKGAPAYVHLYPEGQLRQALREADYAVLCLRASGQNTRLFDAAMLAAMKPGAVLINVARGSLIDENALVASLQTGHLRGAGLDVFWDEPADPGHPLFQLPQVIATPHIAGVTDVNLAGTFQVVAENLQRYRKGETPLHLVTHPTLLRSAANTNLG